MKAKTKGQPDGLDSLRAAMEEACREMREPEFVPPPVEERVWSVPQDETPLVWSHPLFGTLSVRSIFPMVRAQQVKTGVYTELACQSTRPDMVPITIEPTGNMEVLIFRGIGPKLDRLDSTSNLDVAVRWQRNDEGQEVPHTRATDKDNQDFFFLRKDGKFVQLRVFLSTRFGKFWLSVQEIFSGQIVKTRSKGVTRLGMNYARCTSHTDVLAVAVALYPEFAYPGYNFLKPNKKAEVEFMKRALKLDYACPLYKAVVAEWQPQFPEMSQGLTTNGYKPAVVLWYEWGLGWGYCSLPDGTWVWTYFDKILGGDGEPVGGKGEFPLLEPLTPLRIQVEQGGQGPATSEVRLAA